MKDASLQAGMREAGAKPMMQGRLFWLIGLMTALLFVNYIDRGNLATVGPLVAHDLRLSNTEFGLLLAAFYWTYAPAQLVLSWVCPRVDTFRLLTIGALAWSLTTAATSLATGFASLLGMRLLLGIGESVIYPASSTLFAQLVPEERRGAANGWMQVGLWVGPAIGTYVGALIAAGAGWQATFLVFGTLSMLWLGPWSWFSRTTTHPSIATVGPPPRYRDVLAKRSAWGAFVGHFSSNYSFYFVIGWLPKYLVDVRGLSLTEMGMVGGLLFYSITAAACVAGGLYADFAIRRGASVSRMRKLFVVSGQIGSGVCLVLCGAFPSTAVTALLASAVFFGISSGPVLAIGQTLAGPRAAGQWIGMQNFVGNLAGIVTLPVTGILVDRFGNYGWAFAVAGAVTFLGAAAWGLIIPKVEPIEWARTQPDAASP
jgi:MFS family permease